jgi:thiosulfate/3-mercaptopyruvate sulfurtransferase
MTQASFGPLVSPDWLAAHLGEPDLRVVDATWYMPQLGRDGRAEHAQAHVPGACFFDIDEIADHASALPHMLPSPEQFAAAVGALGIGEGDRVVAYGARNMIASARAWWMFRVFGHDAVAVLDGGFPKWRAEGRPLEAGAVTPAPRRFTSRFRPHLVADLDRVRANLERRSEQVIDARSSGRFNGTEPEPRPGLRGGHIPGSLSLPYDRLFRPEDGAILPLNDLERAFVSSGLDLGRPTVAT